MHSPLNRVESDSSAIGTGKSRPLVGMVAPARYQPVAQIELSAGYPKAVVAAGCLPVIVPLVEAVPPEELIRSLDAMIFGGGPDINPLVYGEQPQRGLRALDSDRDRLELQLMRAWLDTGKPMLGIGRGMQLLMVAGGGTLHQDLAVAGIEGLSHEQKAPLADPCHSIVIEAHSTLAQWMEADGEHWVNSLHHQAVAHLAPGFQISARAADGVIEAVEAEDGSPVLGVQWHPEAMCDDPAQRKLFAGFAAYCGLDSLLD